MRSSFRKVLAFARFKNSYLFGLVIGNDYEACKTLPSRIKEHLRRVGFVANAEKSIWEPVQSIGWLGLCWKVS